MQTSNDKLYLTSSTNCSDVSRMTPHRAVPQCLALSVKAQPPGIPRLLSLGLLGSGPVGAGRKDTPGTERLRTTRQHPHGVATGVRAA